MDANAFVAGDAEVDTEAPPKRDDGRGEAVLDEGKGEAAGMAGVSFGAAGGAGAEEAEAKEKGVDVVVDVPKPEKPANFGAGYVELQVLVG